MPCRLVIGTVLQSKLFFVSSSLLICSSWLGACNLVPRKRAVRSWGKATKSFVPPSRFSGASRWASVLVGYVEISRFCGTRKCLQASELIDGANVIGALIFRYGGERVVLFTREREVHSRMRGCVSLAEKNRQPNCFLAKTCPLDAVSLVSMNQQMIAGL